MSNIQLVRKIQAEYLQKGRPDLRTGMEVEVSQRISEGNKERVQKFKGIIILTKWANELEKTITVRRKIGAFGVEKVFAIHSPTVEKIEVLRQFKVRKKSIKFIRDLTGKAARLKEVKMNKEELNAERALPTVVHSEEVVIVDPKGEAKVETEIVKEENGKEELVETAQEVEAKAVAGETLEEIVENAEEKVKSEEK